MTPRQSAETRTAGEHRLLSRPPADRFLTEVPRNGAPPQTPPGETISPGPPRFPMFYILRQTVFPYFPILRQPVSPCFTIPWQTVSLSIS
jgi:hypothetical protein